MTTPYAWAIDACSKMWRGEFAEMDAKAEAARCGGTCRAFPLYDYPVPQVKCTPLSDAAIWKDDEIMAANSGYGASFETLREIVRAVEKYHNIGNEK